MHINTLYYKGKNLRKSPFDHCSNSCFDSLDVAVRAGREELPLSGTTSKPTPITIPGLARSNGRDWEVLQREILINF